jgi:hypothetical protein
MRSRRSETAKSQNDRQWALAHTERESLAEDLFGLGAEQWRHHTLCRQWDVEQVVARNSRGSSHCWKSTGPAPSFPGAEHPIPSALKLPCDSHMLGKRQRAGSAAV